MIKKIKGIVATALISSSINILEAKDYSESFSNFKFSLGAGVAVVPTYEGSESYIVSPIPVLNIQWKDNISLGWEGLNLSLLKSKDYKVGLGLVYNSGRKESGDTLFTNSNDNSLKGMGDIDSALGTKVFMSYNFIPFTLNSSITKYHGSDNDGLLVDFGFSKKLSISDNFFLTPSLKTTWADNNYMETFFGVNSQQSIDSGFNMYSAKSGFKDIRISLNAMYSINKNWFIMSTVQVKQLLGDTADSPISFSDTNTSVFSSIAYKF